MTQSDTSRQDTTLAPFRVLDARACLLSAGELAAVFLPSLGMLGASLRHRGDELLGRVEDLAGFARAGRTCGIPLLYPWANRLAGTRYSAAGQFVSLAEHAELLGHDDLGQPMHGIPWSRLAWTVTDQTTTALRAKLEWDRAEWLAVFPFRHRVEMNAWLAEDSLSIECAVTPTAKDRVPISFGFHPYLKLPGLARGDWNARFPAMSHLELDARKIPTGRAEPFAALDGAFGARTFDDAFALDAGGAAFVLSGGGRQLTLEFAQGYRFAQLFAPPDKDVIAIEPMTAPANALVSGQSLHIIAPGETYRAKFVVRVTAVP